MKLIEKLLIANRGEIAIRIIRTAKKMGIQAMAIYAANEEEALHVKMADEAFNLGPGDLKETYLNISRILGIATLSGCDAVHPGYGFLAENPDFATACIEAGLVFVGPRPDAILKMGNKILAREMAMTAGIPVTKGITGDLDALMEQSPAVPFPVLVKAAAGGGGKGMRIVYEPESLRQALENTSREAASYFGDGSVYLEQYIEDPRHIEIQVLGDNNGNIIHLYERECTIQRRYQKIIEESPSVTLDKVTREKMGKAAVDFARTIAYNNTGTVEFLVDKNMNFYFLEMNTRIQVEHPVTEMVTGIDMVEEQLLIASGYPLRMKQQDVTQHGHALECRIYAEDPASDFLPSPGEITLYGEPRNKDVRIDSSIEKEGLVRSQYDPMISKLIVWGNDRELAIRKMIQNIDQYHIHGIKNNLAYLKGILQLQEFRDNHLSTSFCQEHTTQILENIDKKKASVPLYIPVTACLLFSLCSDRAEKNLSPWERIGFWRLVSELTLNDGNSDIQVEILRNYGKHYHFLINNKEFETSLLKKSGAKIDFNSNGVHHFAFVSQDKNGFYEVSYNGFNFCFVRNDVLEETTVYATRHSEQEDKIMSLIPGKIVKVNVQTGQKVIKGELLLIVEAMKMENNILAPKEGYIGTVNLKTGDLVDARTELLQILDEPADAQ